jgi:hypothetical protein
MRRILKHALLLCLLGGALLLAWLGRSAFTPEPLELRFLYYTNNEMRSRIAVLEITNRSDTSYEWHLRSGHKGVNYVVAITDLVETNGLRGVLMGGGLHLFEHDALQFATDDFRPGQRLWVAIKHHPKTSDERWLEKMSSWMERCGLRRGAEHLREGRKINGPIFCRKTPTRAEPAALGLQLGTPIAER